MSPWTYSYEGRPAGRFKILARHEWVAGATITESESTSGKIRSFTATIRGWHNWKIAIGPTTKLAMTQYVISRVTEIRDLIDSGDGDIFFHKNEFAIFN